MFTTKIMLSSIEDVRKFVKLTNECDFEVNLTNKKYKIDAKSIMGVFSLDLSQPLTVEVADQNADALQGKLKELEPAEKAADNA